VHLKTYYLTKYLVYNDVLKRVVLCYGSSEMRDRKMTDQIAGVDFLK